MEIHRAHPDINLAVNMIVCVCKPNWLQASIHQLEQQINDKMSSQNEIYFASKQCKFQTFTVFLQWLTLRLW